MVPQDRVVVLIERIDSPQPLRIVRPLGGRSLLHVASNGKAVLAHLSAKEQDAYLARSLRAVTKFTITDSGELRAELTRIRKNGYAVSLGELDEDVRAVASPILLAGVMVSGRVLISCRSPRGSVSQVGVGASALDRAPRERAHFSPSSRLRGSA